jgi:hypothetical protein
MEPPQARVPHDGIPQAPGRIAGRSRPRGERTPCQPLGARRRRAVEATWYCPPVATVPLDEGAPDRRRVGPFWLEEGNGLLWVGGLILAVVACLYVLAVVLDHA